jgi:hypothetical protein
LNLEIEATANLPTTLNHLLSNLPIDYLFNIPYSNLSIKQIGGDMDIQVADFQDALPYLTFGEIAEVSEKHPEVNEMLEELTKAANMFFGDRPHEKELEGMLQEVVESDSADETNQLEDEMCDRYEMDMFDRAEEL